jgi:AraC-like DNA-binding protein
MNMIPLSGQDMMAPARPGGITPVVFSTLNLPHRQRLDAWNARFRSRNAVQVADAAASSLSVHNENWMLGPMLLSANRITSARFERGLRQLRLDGLDHWVVRVMRRGVSEVRLGETCHRLGVGEPFLFSLDQSWIKEWTDCEWVSLCLPRDAFPCLSADLTSLGAGPLKGPCAPLLADYLFLLERHVREATPEHIPALVETTRAILGACLPRSGQPQGATASAGGRAQFERLRMLIRRNIASPSLSAQRLARLAGMSRSSLYRLFEPHGGVASYIQGQRLRLVHGLLSDPGLAAVPVGTLAERAGFFDASAFSRAFRTTYGYPPREARVAALSGLPLPGTAFRPDAMREGDFGSLLRGISGSAVFSAGAARDRTP